MTQPEGKPDIHQSQIFPGRILGSDVCRCGEYRSQHDNGGRCRVCANSRAPYDGCTEFRYHRKATPGEQEHWDKYHAELSKKGLL